MRLLIDTHCWLWWLSSPESLNAEARKILASRQNRVLLSAASSWEIAIKFALGKLKLPEPPEKYVPGRMADQGMDSLPIEHIHALRVASLPPHHRDPFDRLLIAQAQVEKLPILTADRKLADYGIELIWGGSGKAPRM